MKLRCDDLRAVGRDRVDADFDHALRLSGIVHGPDVETEVCGVQRIAVLAGQEIRRADVDAVDAELLKLGSQFFRRKFRLSVILPVAGPVAGQPVGFMGREQFF